MAASANKKSAKSGSATLYDIVIVGAGPSGLSAAVRASQQGLHYILLEAEQAPANTVRHYQRPFVWRKKWQAVWQEVKYCSHRCQQTKNRQN